MKWGFVDGIVGEGLFFFSFFGLVVWDMFEHLR